MWLLGVDLRFAGNHYNQIVVTMLVLGADIGFARYHYNQIVVPVWLLSSLQQNSGVHVGTGCKRRLC